MSIIFTCSVDKGESFSIYDSGEVPDCLQIMNY